MCGHQVLVPTWCGYAVELIHRRNLSTFPSSSRDTSSKSKDRVTAIFPGNESPLWNVLPFPMTYAFTMFTELRPCASCAVQTNCCVPNGSQTPTPCVHRACNRGEQGDKGKIKGKKCIMKTWKDEVMTKVQRTVRKLRGALLLCWTVRKAFCGMWDVGWALRD